jgi:hypothetical protein
MSDSAPLSGWIAEDIADGCVAAGGVVEGNTVEGGVTEGGVVAGSIAEGWVAEGWIVEGWVVGGSVCCGTGGVSLSGSVSVLSGSSPTLGGLRRLERTINKHTESVTSMNTNGTEGMMIFPGPQGLTSKLCGTDLLRGARLWLGLLDADDEGAVKLVFTTVDLEAVLGDELEAEVDERTAPSSSSSRSSLSRTARNA